MSATNCPPASFTAPPDGSALRGTARNRTIARHLPSGVGAELMSGSQEADTGLSDYTISLSKSSTLIVAKFEKVSETA
jgi:hypothetical protein